MRPLTAPELLEVWEHGRDAPPFRRALLLLAAACPEATFESLGELPIGARDERLLTLRAWTFGPRLTSVASCPACGERLELTFDVDDIRAGHELPADPLELQLAEYALRVRLPNSHDIAALAGMSDPASSQRVLLQRCVLDAQHDGQAYPAEALPPNIEQAIVERLAQADPQAEIQLALCCPACAHGWQALFDIVSFFWSEIDSWAYQLMKEIHILASAYGWRESDILALSAWRRRIYLEMVLE
jgi:hypothetical protein